MKILEIGYKQNNMIFRVIKLFIFMVVKIILLYIIILWTNYKESRPYNGSNRPTSMSIFNIQVENIYKGGRKYWKTK